MPKILIKSAYVVILPHFHKFQFDDSDDNEPNYDDLEYYPGRYELGTASEDGSFASFYHRYSNSVTELSASGARSDST